MVLLQPCTADDCTGGITGKEFRHNLRKPSPNLPHGKKSQKIRIVPAFTIQALQKGTKVRPPPNSHVYRPKKLHPTLFKKCYLRGEFPITIEFGENGKQIGWKVPIEKLDYHHYLPIFFEGLAEKDYPYTFFAKEGLKDLIIKGSYKVLPVIPQIIMPIKHALATKQSHVICNTMHSLQILVTHVDRVGEALVPYYRQILPICNLFKEKAYNTVNSVDISMTKGETVGDCIEETLRVLERYGGPDAFINIKYMVPTYESCVLN